MLLEVENLNAHYGRSQVLHEVSLTAEKGFIVTLIGSNGAGKTTLMMCLSGILCLTGGKVLFDG